MRLKQNKNVSQLVDSISGVTHAFFNKGFRDFSAISRLVGQQNLNRQLI